MKGLTKGKFLTNENKVDSFQKENKRRDYELELFSRSK